MADKLPEIFFIRENFVAGFLEELKKKIDIAGSHMTKAEARLYLKQNELLEGYLQT